MKNKSLTYGLLIVVGVIWYQVFVRVKSNFEAEAVPPPAQSGMMARHIVKPEAFHLRADYRDPFSGALASAVSETPSAPVALSSVPPPPKPKPEPVMVRWPAIRYYGLVRKTTSEKPRTLITIDGSFYKVRQGDIVLDDILIRKVTREFVEVTYRKETKTFYKAD